MNDGAQRQGARRSQNHQWHDVGLRLIKSANVALIALPFALRRTSIMQGMW